MLSLIFITIPLQVFSQSGLVSECPEALWALESLDIVMFVHVAFIVSPHCEAAMADSAEVRCLVEVLGISVKLQALNCGEGDSTHVTRQASRLCLCLSLSYWPKLKRMCLQLSFGMSATF